METRLTLEELNSIAEIDFVYRNNSKVKLKDRPRITSAKDAHDLFRHYWNCDKLEIVEEFWVMYLNRSNRVLSIMKVSSGNGVSTVIDFKIILAIAIKIPCFGIIVAHNHPSGNQNPSSSDLTLTQQLKKCIDFFDMKLLDHIILTSDNHYSFAENGDL